MPLTPAQSARYARHLSLPEFGAAGQEKLLKSSVLIIGAGGLGSPLCLYLAAAGVGRIGIMDFDAVDHSNLQRQIIHRTQDVGTNKALSAKRGINDLNPEVVVETYQDGITSANALDLVAKYDVVIDGTDNFPTRYLVNDACVFLGKVNIYGSIYRFEGQATVFDTRIESADGTRNGPCYRCLYPGAAATWRSSLVRRRRRARRAARHHRLHPSHRDGEDPQRHGPLARRPAAAL